MGRTDRDIARHARTLARARSRRAARQIADNGLDIAWPGSRTPEWDRFITVQGRMIDADRIVANLSLLLDGDDQYSIRLDGYGDLVIDGDWLWDFDGNGDALCTDCAYTSVLAGQDSVAGLSAAYSYIQDVDYVIKCDQCKAVIRFGCQAILVCEVSATETETDPREWDNPYTVADRGVEYQIGSGLRKWYQDGQEDTAIAYAKWLTGTEAARTAYADQGLIVQVRYYASAFDCGDPYGNSVLWDSTMVDALETEAASA